MNNHPNECIEEAIVYAKENGWKIEETINSSLSWGIMKCIFYDKKSREASYCQSAIWLSPKDALSHAAQIRKIVEKCKISILIED